MKVVVVGGGAREDAIAELYFRSGAEVATCSGNVGTARWGERLTGIPPGTLSFMIRESRPDLVVIGGEEPLCAGLADELRGDGLRVIGACRSAAMIEGSKEFGKSIAKETGIPVAPSPRDESDFPYYFKYDGLAAGKGTMLVENKGDFHRARAFATADGRNGKYHLEKPLSGTEFSSFLYCREGQGVLIGHAMDFKRFGPDVRSPMTGGMASVSPHPRIARQVLDSIATNWCDRTLFSLKKRGIKYEGILYLGGMMTEEGAFLLEYNTRFGDPETQALLSRFVLEDPGDFASLRQTSDARHAALVIATVGYPSEKRGITIEVEHLDSLAQSVSVYFGVGAERNSARYLFEGGRILTAVARSSADVVRIRDFCSRTNGVICRFDVLYPGN